MIKFTITNTQNAVLDEALLEARYKDVKAKYSQYKDLVDAARDYIKGKLGDKGVSKYILYIMRETHQMLGKPETFEEVLEAGPERSEVETLMFDLIDTVEKFEKNTARIKEKDIYKLNAAQLEKIIDDLPKSRSEKGKKEKEQAIEGSQIVYEDDDMFAVRPYTTNASCYYGKNTRWCISATQAYNYFDEYTSKGRGFVMVRMENLKEDDPNKKIAIVYDDGGEFEEAYDAPDDQMGYIELRNAVAQNWAAGEEGLSVDPQRAYDALDEDDAEKVQEILDKLMNAGSANILDNPPEGEDIYEKVESIEREYEDSLTNAYYSSDVEDNNVYYTGGFSIDLSNDEVNTEEIPDDWRSLTAAGNEIQSALDQELSVYVQEVDIELWNNGDVSVRIEVEGGHYDPSPEGYDSFLNDLSDYNKRYESMVRLVKKAFTELGWMGESDYDSFAKQINDLSGKLSNFNVSQDTDLGDEEVRFKSTTFTIPEVNYEFIKGKLSDINVDRDLKKALTGLNKKIVSYLKQQLPLPGIPQAKIKELTIPEMLSVYLFFQDGSVQGFIDLKIDDLSITKESINAIVDVVNFIDNNFKEVAEMTIKIVQSHSESTLKEYREEIKRKFESILKEKISKALSEKQKKKSSGKKDACYHKVKSRYKVWPSAYASGALVKCRKVGAKNWGNKSKKTNEAHCTDEDEKDKVDEKRKLTKKPGSESNLGDWFKRKGAKGSKSGWVDCNTCRKDKKTGKKTCKACGRSTGEKRAKYPKCRPTPGACSEPGNYGKKSKSGRKG